MARVLMKGCEAIAEAAVRAGCRFFAGYPITPRTKFPSILPAACRKLAVTLSRVSPRSLLSIWFTVPLPLVPAP